MSLASDPRSHRLPDELEPVRACPVCGTAQRDVLHTSLRDRTGAAAPGSWTLYRCARCRSAYLDPRPARVTLARAYDSYYTHAPTIRQPPRTRAERLRRALRNGYLNARYGYAFEPASALGPFAMRFFPLRRDDADRWIRHLPHPRRPSALLDVGCGNGDFLTRLQDTRWSLRGLDPDPRAVAVVRAAGIDADEGVLGADTYPAERFGAITMNHVIEHVPDPLDLLRACWRCLQPGGLLWIATPNLASTGHDLFGRDWQGLDPPRHLVVFVRDAIEEALTRAGFDLVARPTACSARWTYPASAAVARGLDPAGEPPRLTPRLRGRAWLADLRCLAGADGSEEIALVARKPAA